MAEASHVMGFHQRGNAVQEYSHGEHVRIAVDVAVESQMIGSAVVPRGAHTVDIPAFELPAIQALVETELDELEGARRAYDRKLAAFKESHPAGALIADSPEKIFRERMERDVLPLRSCEVVGAVSPPLSDQERRTAAVVQQMGADAAAEVAPAVEAPKRGRPRKRR